MCDRSPQKHQKILSSDLALPAVVFGVPLLLLFAPTILTGQIPFFMDVVTQFYPVRVLAASVLRQGLMPFWNPTWYCGTPLWANPQWGVAYPGLWPFLLIPTPGLYTFLMVCHTWLGAMGMYAWVRAEKLGRAEALTAGAFYLLNGFTWAHYAFGSYFFALWAIPWIMALHAYLRDAIENNNKFSKIVTFGIIIGILGACMILAGAPQIVWLTVFWVMLIVLCDFCVFAFRKNGRAVLKLMGACIIASIVAVCVSAPQLLPMLALQAELTRAEQLPIWRVATGALNFKGLVHAFLGGAGFPEDANTTAYFGGFALILICIGLFKNARRRWCEAIALFFFIILAWNFLTPFFYQVLPGFSKFHDPRRSLAMAVPLLCFFSAYGVNAIRSLPDTKYKSALAWFIPLLGVCVALEILIRWGELAHFNFYGLTHDALGWVTPPPVFISPLLALSFLIALCIYIMILAFSPEFKTRPSSKGQRLATTLIMIVCVQMAIFAISRVDLKFVRAKDFYVKSEAAQIIEKDGGRYFAYDPTRAYSYEYTRENFAASLMPNVGAMWGLRDFQGYDPAIPRKYRKFFIDEKIGGSLYENHFGLVDNPWASGLERAGVKWAVGDISSYYPAVPRDTFRTRQTLNLLLPDEQPRRIDSGVVSLVIAPQVATSHSKILIAQIEYSSGDAEKTIIVAPDNYLAHSENVTTAALKLEGNRTRVIFDLPIDSGREVRRITLASQLQPQAILDFRSRLDLIDLAPWERVETTDPIALFRNTNVLDNIAFSFVKYDRIPPGFIWGLVMFTLNFLAICGWAFYNRFAFRKG